jgi:transposase
MTIVSVGIDLAKNVFAVHGVDATGKPALVRPSVPRARLLELIASLPACLIGMEACSGAHHWAREFQKFGHTVRLMAPKFVIPYRLSGKRGKNDAADAAAICEAVTRPNMRFVPVKSTEQQGQLLVHRARLGFVEQRTATLNRIRGLLKALVPATYFLVTFKLPAQLRALAWAHQRLVYELLMRCAWETLKTFSQNDPRLSGTPGALAVLHTHNRQLGFHPHVHVCMPAAALDAALRL